MFSLSIIWLITLVVVALAYTAWLWKNSDYSAWETILYTPVYVVGRLLWRVSFTNDPPKELQSGGILAANHRSSVDPFFVQLAAKRRVHWMVAREYCEHFLFGKVLKPFMVIPTNRSGLDLKSTKQAIEYAQQGRLVGMFPEGRINITQAPLLPIRGGAAMVAIKTGVPVIPLYIEGSPYGGSVWSPLLMPGRVRITFGTPIFPNNLNNATSTEESCSLGEAEVDSAQRQLHSLILQWGQQVVALSGHRGAFEPQLGAGSRKRQAIEKNSQS